MGDGLNTDFHNGVFLSHTDLTDKNGLINSADAAVLINTDLHKCCGDNLF